jgi:hypothetical protein
MRPAHTIDKPPGEPLRRRFHDYAAMPFGSRVPGKPFREWDMATVTFMRGVLVVIASLGATNALALQGIDVSTPQQHVAVEPGYSVDVPILIANHNSTVSPPLTFVLTDTSLAYTFEQRSAPECGPIGPDPADPDWTQFAIAPIAAGATRTCTIRVTRDPNEINNTFIDWVVSETDSWVYFDLGTFVDVSIAGTKLDAFRTPDGAAHATYRLEVHNAGTIDVAPVGLALGSACPPSRIGVDTDFPGACEGITTYCGFGGSSPGAQLPAVAAGASSSCLVRFSAPLGVDPSIAVGFGALYNAETGGFIGDDATDNDMAVLDFAPQQRGHSAHSAPRQPRR